MAELSLTQFRGLLLELGFTDRSVAGKYYRFEHSMPNTWVLLPPYKADDLVMESDIVATRRLLDARGLISDKEFDKMLRNRSLAS